MGVQNLYIYKKRMQLLLWLHNNTFKIAVTNVVCLLAERSESKSNDVMLDGFRSRLRASNVSSHTEEFC